MKYLLLLLPLLTLTAAYGQWHRTRAVEICASEFRDRQGTEHVSAYDECVERMHKQLQKETNDRDQWNRTRAVDRCAYEFRDRQGSEHVAAYDKCVEDEYRQLSGGLQNCTVQEGVAVVCPGGTYRFESSQAPGNIVDEDRGIKDVPASNRKIQDPASLRK